jgi:hypothetical protein
MQFTLKKKRSAKLQVLKRFYTLIKAIMLLQKLLCVSKGVLDILGTHDFEYVDKDLGLKRKLFKNVKEK